MLGLSWGTTLGLAYAETYPDRVSGLVLGLVTLATRREVDWMTYDLRRLHPEEWERFAAIVPESLAHLPIVDAYAELLADPDPSVRDLAAREWVAWDYTQVGYEPPAVYADPDVRLVHARLVTHYWRNAGFLGDDQLVRDAVRLDGIPGAIVQGADDVSCPPDMAWELAKRWTTAELTIVDAGHGKSRTAPDAFPAAVTEALDRLRLA
jgi:proline iminopeptidase